MVEMGTSQLHDWVPLKCLYNAACSMDNKQEELEVCMQLQCYDPTGIRGLVG